MDRIVHAALDEICSQGTTGLSLSHLWPRLNAPLSSASIPLCPAVKRAVFLGLSAVPGLQFKTRDGGTQFDPKSKPFEEFESLDVAVVADEQLRRCFVGLYDVKASHITAPQQRVLERLALARGNGVTQNQLCKELNTPANNFFYVVKRLESWGLVVRQSTIVRKKEVAGGRESKSSQPVHTNMIRLIRYAPQLSSQQRLEITKDSNNLEENNGENVTVDDVIPDECGQDDVLVKDFLPAMKAICDRLEQAEGKVLVVSDIKRELGYRETRGHRAWRNVCNRLKQAGLVEVFEANLGGDVETPTKMKQSKSRGRKKPVSCLKLLKNFSPKHFKQKGPDCEHDSLESDPTVTSGKKIQYTEQLVELPLEQQIFDMIAAEGSKGLLGVELCKRLGISNKRFDHLSNTIVPRFGLRQLSENHKRGLAYRFWTRENFRPEIPNISSMRLDDGPADNSLTSSPVETFQGEDSGRNISFADYLNSQSWLAVENKEKRVFEKEIKNGSQEDKGSSEMVVWAGGTNHDMSITLPGAFSPVPKPFNLQQGQIYPSLTSATRELRIMERLKTEKIIIKPELQRWLESFEKDKQTRMDRKTLKRCLIKLKMEGHCKLMDFNIPGVSNCGRHREVHVILHPSVEGSASELSEQVHDKVRSFEMQIRSAVSPLKKEAPVPVLHGIERIQMNSASEAGSAKAEAMRANGFAIAKMVRSKLLHGFLWDYVHNSAINIEMPTSITHINGPSNPHSSCVLFSLDAAIKAMPLELFLQVVGSALKWKDMIEKCNNGFLLSSFSDDEYKSLMDTRATSRLSWLIDILRRLKLIRLVVDDNSKDAVKMFHATLVYALELKPYIEEPPLVGPLPGCSGSVDLRPHFRHDFVLSTSEALEKYWQTLEYCYAAADPKAAVHAFPGSVAYEVCLYRSWTTVRVMKAEQRAKLLKRIKDQQRMKLTFKECREIAKDLNLTLEQVLRVYYDNRQQRLNRFSDGQVMNSDARTDRPQSRSKRKRSSEGGTSKHEKVTYTSGGEEDNLEEPEPAHYQEEDESLVDQCIMPMLKPTRQQKFSWTEDADRHLLIQYARQRATQGARRGTEWASMRDLPAPPSTCRRRVALLNSDVKFRKSLMRLCNLLTQRYARHRDREKNIIDTSEHNQEVDYQVTRWDDFDDSKIKVAFNEVLLLKQMMKLDSTKRTGSATEGIRNCASSLPCEFENASEKQQIGYSRKSRRNRLPLKFVKHLKEGICVTGRVNQSLAVSNAVELFKLVFLTNSKSANMPNLLAETLRCYSEHDLYSAFDYLRQKNYMIGSAPSQPFVLSQNFLRSISESPFPMNTGTRAARLAGWLHEMEKTLMEGVVNLPSDLQCGDIVHLFALVSSGELSIAPLLPHEGVGEAEDSRTSKRKYDDLEFAVCGVSKKHRFPSSQECEIFSRREKGFPGITVSLSRTAIMTSNIVKFFTDEDQNHLSGGDHFYTTLGQITDCPKSSFVHVENALDFSGIVPAAVISGDSSWEVMANYICQKLQKVSEGCHCVNSELVKTAYTNIQKAGDQGLSMSMISECTGVQDTTLTQHIVDALEQFGFALKVNGYNYVHVVDGIYRAKYFLTSKVTCPREPERLPSTPQKANDNRNIVGDGKICGDEMNSVNADKVHQVTIQNLSEDSSQLDGTEAREKLEGWSQTTTQIGASKTSQNIQVTAVFQPILPWMNGDGTINSIVYRGLTRRVLGIVYQNPGILEVGICCRMEALNPQSCRKLLELMVLDKHLILRKLCQRKSSPAPPALLKSLFGNNSKEPKYVCREHYFANPMSTSLL